MMVSVVAAVGVLVFLGGFTIFFWSCFRMGMGGVQNPLSDGRNVLLFIVASLLCLYLCYYLISQNDFVYYWDLGGYWTLSYTTMNELFSHPYEAWKHIYHSIRHDDYNLLLPLLLSLPLKFFGYTFLRYAMLVCAIFLLPAMFFLSSVAWKLLEPPERHPGTYGIILLILVTFNAFYGAVFNGYIDAGCLIPASLAVLLAIDSNLASWNRQQVVRDICIALLLLCTFLMRRYFAYFIVGYMTALVICTLLGAVSDGKNWRDSCRPVVKNFCVIGGTATAVLLIFCMPIVKHIFYTDYSQQYVGYDLPFWEKVSGAVDYFGIFVIAMAIIAVIASVISGRWRRMTVFLFVMAIVTALDFFKVQAMGFQHVYTICVPIALLLFLAYAQLSRCRLNTHHLVTTLFSLILILGMLHSFRFAQSWLTAPLASVYPAVTFRPLQRGDIQELRALAAYLDEQADFDDLNVYVLASGATLNSSIFDALDKPYGTGAVRHLFGTHDVDLRDGFPADFLKADIVVVTDPIDLHLAPGTQEVVRYLATEVQDADSPIGRHFQKDTREFALDPSVETLPADFHIRYRLFKDAYDDMFQRGMRAIIYRKVSEFTEDDLQSLADYYTDIYPGQEKIFADRILSGRE